MPGFVSRVNNDDGTPWAVYGSERLLLNYAAYPGDILYTVPNITPGVNHTVRLYFFTNGHNGTHSGDVLFDV
jgi:hypothetical protein